MYTVSMFIYSAGADLGRGKGPVPPFKNFLLICYCYFIQHKNFIELFMYGFTIRIKMLVSAKALPTGYMKESAFTKHLLTYLLQQTKVFNCALNAS